ncbi:MAG: C-GCAxxG-C-C family protein [Desulfobulbaceae bacterium]
MAVGQKKMNMQDAGAVRAVGAYGGGIASSGGVCGILLGAIALISSIYSRASLAEKEDPRLWVLSRKFMREFEKMTEPYGGSNCRDIARVDWRDRDAVKAYYADPDSRRQECIRLVGEAAEALGRLLEEELRTNNK